VSLLCPFQRFPEDGQVVNVLLDFHDGQLVVLLGNVEVLHVFSHGELMLGWVDKIMKLSSEN